jgi:carboxyl-terminal processing protease
VRLPVVCLLILLTGKLGLAATPLSPEQRRLNLESFEYVWATIRDKHWDPKIGGLDWQSVHDELRPRVESAQTVEEARQIVASMLDRLQQTHFGVIPADAYEAIGDNGETSGGNHGQTGIDLRILGGRAIVSSIMPNSPAQETGVRTGWEIVRIGKTDVAPLIATIAEGTGHSRLTDMMSSRSILSKLDGSTSSEVAVEFSDINGKQIGKHLKRRVESGDLTTFGFLPPMLVNFNAKKLPGDGGGDFEYIHFNLFLKPDLVVTRFGEAIHDCGHCPGVIIDLRGNPGGLGAMAMGMAGFLISKPDQKLGTMYMRSLPIRFVIFPRPEVFEGPVAVLVDSFTASTSEIFAGGLQDLKRARVFGERTAGAALPSRIERLPNGDGFQYAMANYISESGRQLEGNGVIPDVDVPPDRKSLSEGKDAVLEAALNWLLTQAKVQGKPHAKAQIERRGSAGSIAIVPKTSNLVNGGPPAIQSSLPSGRLGR